MISVIDYDAGNLKSVEKALISLGEEVVVSRDSSAELSVKCMLRRLPAFMRRQ